jgi:hypothetical protein
MAILLKKQYGEYMSSRHNFIISTLPSLAPGTCEVEWQSRYDGLHYKLDLKATQLSPEARIFNKISAQDGLLKVLHELESDYSIESKLIAEYKPPELAGFFGPFGSGITPGSSLWTMDDEQSPTLNFNPPGNVSKVGFINGYRQVALVNDAKKDAESRDGKSVLFDADAHFKFDAWYKKTSSMKEPYIPNALSTTWYPYAAPAYTGKMAVEYTLLLQRDEKPIDNLLGAQARVRMARNIDSVVTALDSLAADKIPYTFFAAHHTTQYNPEHGKKEKVYVNGYEGEPVILMFDDGKLNPDMSGWAEYEGQSYPFPETALSEKNGVLGLVGRQAPGHSLLKIWHESLAGKIRAGDRTPGLPSMRPQMRYAG